MTPAERIQREQDILQCLSRSPLELEEDQVRAELITAAIAWSESDACVIDEKTPRETFDLYKAINAYIRLGVDL